jgi:hypothetical protein
MFAMIGIEGGLMVALGEKEKSRQMAALES